MFVLIVLNVNAQSEYESVLQQVEANNTTLAALRQQTDAQKIANRTGLMPDNPEVDFSHLWGPENTMDFSVTQTFDFPTAYGHRRKISALQNENVEHLYKTQRIEVLLSAKQKCIELVYYNILAKEYAARLKNAEFIADAYKTKLEKGETNILEHNKAQLSLASMQVEVAQIEAERIDLLAQLKLLNGGKDIVFSAGNYPANALPSNFEEWYAKAESENPELQAVRKQIEIDKQQIELNRAMGLPKFSAGYIGEITRDDFSHGVTVGLSIPLWENKNRVSEARAQARATEFALKDSQAQLYSRLQSQYLKASFLQQNALKLRKSLTENDNGPLLKKALEAGEISLLIYLQEIEFFYDAMDKVLETERDSESAAAEFWAAGLY